MPSPAPPLPRLFESIRLADGATPLLDYHQARMDRTRRALFAKSPVIRLKKVLAELDLPERGLYKVRIEYDRAVLKTEILPYTPKVITSLRTVNADDVRYGKKFSDRAAIQACYAQRGDADDVLMIQRGHLTDASYANVALYDGNYWYTPAYPLLRGTRRAQLLDEGILRASVIRERDLVHFERIRLINGMLPWGEGMDIGMERVYRAE